MKKPEFEYIADHIVPDDTAVVAADAVIDAAAVGVPVAEDTVAVAVAGVVAEVEIVVVVDRTVVRV